MQDQNEFKEEVAALCHEQWSGWMKYLFGQGKMNETTGEFVINSDSVSRWKRQMDTDYQDLLIPEKNSDRKEADKFMELFDTSVRWLHVERVEELDLPVLKEAPSALPPYPSQEDLRRTAREYAFYALSALTGLHEGDELQNPITGREGWITDVVLKVRPGKPTKISVVVSRSGEEFLYTMVESMKMRKRFLEAQKQEEKDNE